MEMYFIVYLGYSTHLKYTNLDENIDIIFIEEMQNSLTLDRLLNDELIQFYFYNSNYAWVYSLDCWHTLVCFSKIQFLKMKIVSD